MDNLIFTEDSEALTAKDGSFTYVVYSSRGSFVLEIWKGNSLKILHRYDTTQDAVFFAERHSVDSHEDKTDNIQTVIGVTIITICCIILYSCS